MGTRKVPAVEWPTENRVKEKVPFLLMYVPEFPVDSIGGKLDKDPDGLPWIMGLLDDIRESGHLRNPLTIWNHHPNRGVKQPRWLLRAGSNRMWCVEQLGWKTVPAVVSMSYDEIDQPYTYGKEIAPRDVQSYYTDGGIIWVNEHGFGLQLAKPPEKTYEDHVATSAELADIRTTHHRRDKIVGIL